MEDLAGDQPEQGAACVDDGLTAADHERDRPSVGGLGAPIMPPSNVLAPAPWPARRSRASRSDAMW
jgi:hypothetical protein